MASADQIVCVVTIMFWVGHALASKDTRFKIPMTGLLGASQSSISLAILVSFALSSLPALNFMAMTRTTHKILRYRNVKRNA